jgi:membrane protein implicated in regulation of membrane protease activity
MVINRPSVFRSIDFAIVAISLVVIGTALGCLLFITAGHAAAEPDPNVRQYLARLSWIALTLLLFVVVVFVWMVVRYVSLRLRQRSKLAEPTTYLDAWALAGKRFKLSAKDVQDLAELEIGEDGDQDEEEDKPGGDKDGPSWR